MMASQLRISLGVTRAARVTFSFAGQTYEAYEGESIAAALLAAGVRKLRAAPADGGPRGFFCAIGICQECLVEIDGQRTEACRAQVRSGLVVDVVEYADGGDEV